MDEKAIQALTALANKLGTTTEYLWGVLLSQAPLSALANLAILLALFLGSWMWWKFIQKNTTTPEATKSDPYPSPNWDDSSTTAAYIGLIVMLVIVLIILMASIEGIVCGLINPEYWALSKFMGMLSGL